MICDRVMSQYNTQFAETFSSWMTRHPHVYRVHQLIDVVERTAPVCHLLETKRRVLVRPLSLTQLIPQRTRVVSSSSLTLCLFLHRRI